MGELHKARDTRLDRDVAVKVLAPSRSHTPEVSSIAISSLPTS
jgi:hypothetical protein